MQLITRKELKQYGLSDYLAAAITKPLEIKGKQGRSNQYVLEEVVYAIQGRLDSKRTRQTTKVNLQNVLDKINLPKLSNDEEFYASLLMKESEEEELTPDLAAKVNNLLSMNPRDFKAYKNEQAMKNALSKWDIKIAGEQIKNNITLFKEKLEEIVNGNISTSNSTYENNIGDYYSAHEKNEWIMSEFEKLVGAV